MKEKYDVIVIGAGIAGMTAALYLKRSGLSVLIIEENVPGGQLNKIADIENYPGFLRISGPDLAMNLYNQVNELNVEYLFEKVVDVDLLSDVKVIKTDDKVIYCDYVVIATGKESKKLHEFDEQYIGKGLSYCGLCDGHLYKGLDVAVVGGGNSAIEEMLYLSNVCNKVIGILRGDSFRGEEYLVEQLKKKKNIEIRYHLNVMEYNIENNRLTSIKLDDGSSLKVDGLFISIGSLPVSNIFNVKKEDGYIVVDDKGMTNIKNVYACGDVIKKDIYQLTTAASEGTQVAYNIIKDWKSK